MEEQVYASRGGQQRICQLPPEQGLRAVMLGITGANRKRAIGKNMEKKLPDGSG